MSCRYVAERHVQVAARPNPRILVLRIKVGTIVMGPGHATIGVPYVLMRLIPVT